VSLFPFPTVVCPLDASLSLCSIGKPVVLTAFGLLTTNNLDTFVPFNGTTPVVTQNRKRKSFHYLVLYYHLS
jgi:hypothetical protein